MTTAYYPKAPWKARREPVRIADEGGAELVLVPVLGLVDPAIVDAPTFDRLRSLGISDQWQASRRGRERDKRVVGRFAGRATAIAPLLAGCPPGTTAGFRNGNRADLRACNLRVIRCDSACRDYTPSAVAATAKAYADRCTERLSPGLRRAMSESDWQEGPATRALVIKFGGRDPCRDPRMFTSDLS